MGNLSQKTRNYDRGRFVMTDLQERVTTQVSDGAEGVHKTAGAAEENATGGAEETGGAVGRLVSMLTSGFVMAATTGFIVGVAVGVVVGRRATPPPPRWQVWR
jgi:hypothetical protein